MTGRQATLGAFRRPGDHDLAELLEAADRSQLDELQDLADRLDRVLTTAERRIYVAVEIGDVGVRDYQRRLGWSSPGTASNLLRRAREKLEGAT